MKREFQHIQEAEDFLNQIPMFAHAGVSAADFHLDRMVAFCDFMGNPQNRFPAIHVAGTNGKGSVCRMLASVYQEAGYKTGIYTSPHLTDVRERFRINGELIDSESFLLFFNTCAEHIRQMRYTYFEVTTAIAFWYFANRSVDIALIETGLGGRLDATNVIHPEISIITSVGLDHTDLLGNTFRQIALEKSGIIKKNRPVVIGKMNREAKREIEKNALKQNAPLLNAPDLKPVVNGNVIRLEGARPPLEIEQTNGKRINALNAAMAWKTTQALSDRFPVTRNEFVTGIVNLKQRFPETGTFDKIHSTLDWYFDGGHNPEAVRYITEQMASVAPLREWTAVLSFMKDKLNPEIAQLWKRCPVRYLYAMDSPRAASAEEMLTFFPDAKPFDPDDHTLINQLKTELVIFSGSFYFYNTVTKWTGTIVASELNSFRTQ